MTQYCLYEKDKAKKIATITFNRPEKLNAAVTDHWVEIRDKVVEVSEDEDVKVLIFKGAGRCFGTGHDVADLGSHHGWSNDPKARRPSIRRRLQFDNNIFEMISHFISPNNISISFFDGLRRCQANTLSTRVLQPQPLMVSATITFGLPSGAEVIAS